MIPAGAIIASYLVAGVLFILSLGGLSTQKTAKRGNLYGIIGMVIALAATMLHDRIDILSGNLDSLTLILPAVVLGGAIGAVAAVRVEMTSMPELVAALHSFVGLAAVLVGISTFLDPASHALHGVLPRPCGRGGWGAAAGSSAPANPPGRTAFGEDVATDRNAGD